MTDIQLMRDIIKNNFHFFPNQNHSSKYTDIETVLKKKVSESSVYQTIQTIGSPIVILCYIQNSRKCDEGRSQL